VCRAIVNVARELRNELGNFATRVEEIGDLVRVAPMTVYVVLQGKRRWPRTLIQIDFTAPVVAAMIRQVQELEDPLAALFRVAETCCGMRKDFGDVMRVRLNTSSHESNVAESLATATSRCRQAFLPIAQHLEALDAQRPNTHAIEEIDVVLVWLLSALHTAARGWLELWPPREWLCAEASRPRPEEYRI
jgi:hypothetical protein